jgi:hypothetical protein
MMMSMGGRKGSTRFGWSRRELAILTAPLVSSIVRCDHSLRIKTAGAGFHQRA